MRLILACFQGSKQRGTGNRISWCKGVAWRSSVCLRCLEPVVAGSIWLVCLPWQFPPICGWSRKVCRLRSLAWCLNFSHDLIELIVEGITSLA